MRIALLLLATCLASAVEIPATVKHVTDGDTIAATLADVERRAVVELGGGDAVDLLHIKLDDALGADEPGDPHEN